MFEVFLSVLCFFSLLKEKHNYYKLQMTLSESHQPTKQILWILNVIIQDLIQVFYIFPFYIFFCSFFPCFHLFFLMTSLRYCNVMNYFNGSYTVISYSYGFMEFCPFFFQSPDIITSHIPLSNVTNPSRALSFFPLFLLLPPVPRPSFISSVSGRLAKSM